MFASSSDPEKDIIAEPQEIIAESLSQAKAQQATPLPDRNTTLQEAPERLGKKLRTARKQKGLSIDDICQQTKISRKNITAMEASRHDEMPAFSFCRGFYKMYADAVGLNAEHIIFQFEQEYNKRQRDKDGGTRLTCYNKEVNSMAERPSLLAVSSFGFILVLLLFFAGFLCWFFSWNPASFFSQRLRNISPEERYETSMNRIHRSGGKTFTVINDIPATPQSSLRPLKIKL